MIAVFRPICAALLLATAGPAAAQRLPREIEPTQAPSGGPLNEPRSRGLGRPDAPIRDRPDAPRDRPDRGRPSFWGGPFWGFGQFSDPCERCRAACGSGGDDRLRCRQCRWRCGF